MEASREESLERLIDRKVQRRLVMDGRYRHAASPEEAATAEERIELEAELEVIGEVLESAARREKYAEAVHAPTVEELESRQAELLEQLGL